ncbi:MAG: DNA-directed RNA polymerase subunit E'' [Candidatus Thermoplasmatota archaeon]|jgi:DNA-directed RNA polymerase subunit E"|nr:DNA-directed RNA polymerase subunit E'' [Candidatus Thermoplasmatota archaeon]
MIKLRACRVCKRVTEDLKCHGDTVLEWKGYLFILQPQKSLLAKRTGITTSDEYAIKVR